MGFIRKCRESPDKFPCAIHKTSGDRAQENPFEGIIHFDSAQWFWWKIEDLENMHKDLIKGLFEATTILHDEVHVSV